MMKHIKIYHAFTILACIICLSSCAYTPDNLGYEATELDITQLLAVRTRPTNASELQDECSCMDNEIDSINNFSDKMTNSKFGFFYQSLGRNKVATINSYKRSLNCQRLNQ